MKRIITTLKEKWPEYLIEGIVIVGSIVAAIQLENWNDNRKNQLTAKTYIQSLIGELEKDSISLSQNIAEMSNELEGVYSLSTRLSSKAASTLR